MHKFNTITLYILLFSFLVLCPGFGNAQTTIDEFMAKWENSKLYTLEVIDAMPEDQYDFKPHESAMSFKEHLLHLSATMVNVCNRMLGGEAAGNLLDAKIDNKDQLKKMVSKCYDYANTTFAGLTADDLASEVEMLGNKATKRQVLSLIDDHTTHHRAAAISYIRAQGIKPPSYRGL